MLHRWSHHPKKLECIMRCPDILSAIGLQIAELKLLKWQSFSQKHLALSGVRNVHVNELRLLFVEQFEDLSISLQDS